MEILVKFQQNDKIGHLIALINSWLYWNQETKSTFHITGLKQECEQDVLENCHYPFNPLKLREEKRQFKEIHFIQNTNEIADFTLIFPSAKFVISGDCSNATKKYVETGKVTTPILCLETFIVDNYHGYDGWSMYARLEDCFFVQDCLRWRMINDRNDLLLTFNDKIKSKKLSFEEGILAPKILYQFTGKEEGFASIPKLKQLNYPCVIKTNNQACGKGVSILKSEEALLKLNFKFYQSLLHEPWTCKTKLSAEWASIQCLPACLYIEEKIEDGTKTSVDVSSFGLCHDYKVFVFHGKACCIAVYKEDNSKKRFRQFYDLNWNVIDMGANCKHPVLYYKVEKPKKLESLILMAEKLSKSIDFIRLDFFLGSDEQFYFCEGCAYPAGFPGMQLKPEFSHSLALRWINK